MTPTLTPIKILSTLAVRNVLNAIAPEYEQRTGRALEMTFAATLQIRDKILGGARADVTIMTATAIDEFERSGILVGGARVDLVGSDIGLAVRQGDASPVVTTVEELKAALLQARAVAYSERGASGVYFASLLKKLGIDNAVNAHAVIIPEGLTGTRLVNGEADLAVQQMSELMQVPGINIFAKLPEQVQETTLFSIGIFQDAQDKQPATDLITYLCSPVVSAMLRAQGLDPLSASD